MVKRRMGVFRLISEPPEKGDRDAELPAALAAALPELSAQQRAGLAGFLSRAVAEPGTSIWSEGDRLRDLVIVVRGEARAVRGGAVLDLLHAGDRFGDLGFVTAMPQPCALVAATGLDFVRLSPERHRLLSTSHPELGVALWGALVAKLTQHAPSRSGAGAAIVQDRSLPRRATVGARIHGVSRAVAIGTRVRKLLPERMHDRLVVAALVDRKAVSLTTPITSECEVAALTTAHWEGQRVHRQSLALLALEAARRLEPPVGLAMGPSIGFAQQMIVSDPGDWPLAALATDIERSMRAVVGESAPLREEWWTVDEAREHFEKQGSPAAALLSTWRDPAVALVSFGEVYALQMGPLVPDTGMLDGFFIACLLSSHRIWLKKSFVRSWTG